MAVRAVRARLACSAALFVCFVACLCWSAVCIAGNGADGGKLLVVAVACMCASLVSSFGLLLADLALSVPSSVPSLGVIRTIRVGPMGPVIGTRAVAPIGGAGHPVDEQGPSAPIGPVAGQIIGTPRLSQAVFRRATVFDDSYVAIAVDASPSASSPSASGPSASSLSPKVCVFEPSSPCG